jgi:hypothetical protein
MGGGRALYQILYRLDVKVLVELKFVWIRLVAVYREHGGPPFGSIQGSKFL